MKTKENSQEKLPPLDVVSAFGLDVCRPLAINSSGRFMFEEPLSGQKLILKGQIPEMAPDAERREFLADLQNLDTVPTIAEYLALPLLSNRGSCFIASNGLVWSMSRFRDGDSPGFNWLDPTWNTSHARSAGALLARFHADSTLLLSAVQAAGHRAPRLDLAKALLVNQEQDLPPGQTRDRLEKSLAAINSSPQYLIHGDFHPGNLVFSEGKAWALLDFDYLGLGNAGYDLIYGLLSFARRQTDLTDVKGPPMAALLDFALAAALLKGYGIDCPEAPEEFGLWLCQNYEHELFLAALAFYVWASDQAGKGADFRPKLVKDWSRSLLLNLLA